MSVSTSEFWNLLRQSRLLTSQHIEKLGQEYAQLNGAAPHDAKAVSQWLVSRKALSNYQSMILLAGRSGPFHYGQYMVYDRIDNGRFRGMFRALHAPSRHPVLLQFAAGLALTDAGLWRLISDNAEKHRAVVHPQLNRCFETVDLGSFKFAVVEDLRGESVDALLARGRMPASEACRIARGAALALAQLHMAGLVHGEVRPSNLWVEATGNVKLLRDPLSLPSTLAQLRQTSPEKVAAQADYLAPELAQADKRPDALTDLYALGCALYQMLSGRPPFAGGEVSQKLQRHAAEAIQPLEQQGVQQPVAQIVTYLMAKNPTVRYQQATVVAEQLTPFCDATRMMTQPPSPPPTLATYEAQLRDTVPSFGDAAPTPPPAPGISASGATSTGGGSTPAPVFTADDPRRRVGRKSGGLADVVNDPSKLLSRQGIMYLASGLTALILLLVLAIVVAANRGSGGGSDATADGEVAANTDSGTTDASITDGDTGSPNNSDGGSPGAAAATTFVKQAIVPDDGKALWATPTVGGPVSLDFTPADTKVYLIVRPADIVASEEGEKVLRALGPNFEAMRSNWEAASGFKFEEIEQLIVTLHGDDQLRPAFVVRPKPPMSESELIRRWGGPEPTVKEGETFYAARGWVFYPPRGEGGAVFTMAQQPEIDSVIETHGGTLLNSNVSSMLRVSDADRHVNLIFDPYFVASPQGEKLFAGPYAKLRPAISWLLGADIKTTLVSLHFGKPFYLEMSLQNTGAEDRHDVAKALQARVTAIPGNVEEYMTTVNAHPYWKKLSNRLATMINYLGVQTRVGTEDDVAVMNAVLPEYAASNLFAGGELLINSAPGAGVAVAVAPKKKTPQTLDELLEAKTTIEFPQHDLINAVAVVRQDLIDTYSDLPFDFEIKMMGNQLMEEGITQNQAVRDFKMQDKSIKEILTAMMMKANPVTTVKSPTEEDQKLIWVISPDSAASSTKTILITTRKAAKAEGYTIPPVFLP